MRPRGRRLRAPRRRRLRHRARLRAQRDRAAAAATPPRPRSPASGRCAPPRCARRVPFAAGFGMEIGMTVDASVRATRSARSSWTSSTAPPAARSAASSTAAASCATSARVVRAKRGGIALRADDPRDRPGDDRHDLPRLRRAGEIAGRAYSEFEQHFPRPGWVEHDAAEIWDVTRGVAAEAIGDAGISGADLAGIGITNQRETVVAWDPKTGEPVHHALVWQDRRTAGALRRAARGRPRGPGPRAHRAWSSTPTSPAPRSSGCCATSRRRGTPSSARSTPGSSSSSPAGTSPTTPTPRGRCCSTSASCAWDPELCELLGVDPATLPEAVRSSQVYGTHRSSSAARCRWPGSPATSRRRSSARPATGPGWRRTPTAPGASCCSTPGAEAPEPGEGLLTTVAWGLEAETDVRARGRGLRHRRRGAVAARRARDHRRGGRDRGAGRVAGLQRRRLLRPRADRASARRTGIPTPAARSSASPAAPAAPTSPAPRWRRSPTRRSTPCARRRPPPASGSPSCRPTAARSPTAG